MKLSIEGTPTEINNALQAICGSEERELSINHPHLSKIVRKAINDTSQEDVKK